MIEAKFRTNKGYKKGEVVKVNEKTIWVKLNYKKNIAEEGAKAIFKTFTKIIKRHKIKHDVNL